MKKLIIFTLLLINLYAGSEFKIESIDGDNALIDCQNLKVGESGLVVRNIEKEFNSIIKNATVIKIENTNECLIEFSEFNGLKQDALPTLQETPKINDIVIFNSFYNKGLAIAPDSKTYSRVVNKYSNKSWIHPDIFATYLQSKNNPSPQKEDFIEFCNIYSIGLIYFILDEREYIVDSNSFKIIDTKDINLKKDDKDEIKPFYSRLGDLKASFFSFKSEIKNYKEHYKKLLNIK